MEWYQLAMDLMAHDRLLAVAEGVVTRMCHDMAGLVATVSGTLEMALEDTAPDVEAASLATEAAGQLAARIRLYRAAWGGGDMEQSSLLGLAEGLPNRSRLEITLDEDVTGDLLAAGGSRLVLCLLLAACAGMPAGGKIGVAPEPGGVGGAFSVTLEGRRAAWPQGLARADGAPATWPDELDAGHLAETLAGLLAASIGWRLTIDGTRLIASR